MNGYFITTLFDFASLATFESWIWLLGNARLKIGMAHLE